MFHAYHNQSSDPRGERSEGILSEGRVESFKVKHLKSMVIYLLSKYRDE